MKKLLFTAVLLAAFSPGLSQAANYQWVICQPGGPELGAEQKKILDGLFRYLEGKLQLKSGAISGAYLNKASQCQQAFAKEPAFILPSLPSYLQAAKNYQALVQTQLKGAKETHYYLLVKKEAEYTSAQQLSQKTIVGIEGPSRFFKNLLLEQAPGFELKFKAQKLALRAVRKVIKGKAEAVLIDGTAFNALKNTKYFKQLKVLHQSGPLPLPPVAAHRKQVPQELKKRLQQTLLKMKSDPEGKKMLDIFGVDSFAAVSDKKWQALQSRYER